MKISSAVHTETGEVLRLEDENYLIIVEDPRLGTYEHFKSSGDNPVIYEVVSLAVDNKTSEPLVIYRSLSDKSTLHARPYEMFFETVEHQNETVERFKRISE